MKDETSIFDKIMAAITFAESNESETAIEILDSIKEETTVSGICTPEEVLQGG